MTTWNPNDKTADIFLSNGNLTVTDSVNTYQNVRSDDFHSSGKWYMEMTSIYAFDDIYLGVRKSTVPIASTGQGTDSAGFRSGNFAGTVVCIAVDIDAKKLWARFNGGAWDGGGNPELGSLPTDLLDSAGDWHAWYGSDNSTANIRGVVANFGSSAFAYTVPAGFEAWDGSNTLTVVSCSPDFGPIAGGTAVTITGTGFQAGASVTFDGQAATDVVVVNPTTITCVTPSGDLGFADIVVTIP